MMWWVGIVPFLLVHLPITMLGGAIGIWLFYVQHQFEHTSWSAERDWRLPRGGTLRQLAFITYMTSAPEFRFIGCRLFFAGTPLSGLGRITLRQSFACIRLTLWDEASSRLISFRELRARHEHRRIGRYEGGHVHYSVIAVRS
jgi:omega-6 fatty acid desaturase (delta-12 desaturase)